MNSNEKEYVDSVYQGTKLMDKYYQLFMNITPKGKILDLGCGIGPVSNYLNGFGYDCVGYDIDEYHINMQKKYNPGLNLLLGDIRNIPFQEKKANGAVYAYCLQNLTDNEIVDSFNSCYKNLVDDGKVLIFIVSKLEFKPSFFVNPIDGEKMKVLLANANFKTVYCEYYDENILCVIGAKM